MTTYQRGSLKETTLQTNELSMKVVQEVMLQGRIFLSASNVKGTIRGFVRQVQGVVLLVENPGM